MYSSLPILWLPNLNIGLCSALVIGDIDNNKIASEIKFKGSEKLGSEAISSEGSSSSSSHNTLAFFLFHLNIALLVKVAFERGIYACYGSRFETQQCVLCSVMCV